MRGTKISRTTRMRPLPLALAALAMTAGGWGTVEIRCEKDRTCNGTHDNDEMHGTISNDDMYGLSGHDTLIGRAGRDLLDGGVGVDELRGGKGADVLRAGPVDDTPSSDLSDSLLGGKGPDELYGGAMDNLSGGRGDDRLFGSPGYQAFWLGKGDDAAFGRGGEDWFWIWDVRWGHDTIAASKNHENHLVIDLDDSFEPLSINLNSRANRPEVRRSDGGATLEWKDDVIRSIVVTSRGRDTIRGNEQANNIASHKGKDTIFGGAGNDRIDTAYDKSADTIDCGAGDADEVTYDAEDTVVNCEILHPVSTS